MPSINKSAFRTISKAFAQNLEQFLIGRLYVIANFAHEISDFRNSKRALNRCVTLMNLLNGNSAKASLYYKFNELQQMHSWVTDSEYTSALRRNETMSINTVSNKLTVGLLKLLKHLILS